MLKAPELAVLNSMVGTTWLETLLKDRITFIEVNIDTPLKFPMVLRPYSNLPNTRAALEPELKNILSRISADFPNETILTQAHGWGTSIVKSFNNMLDIGFDVRGRNGFSKFTHTAHLIHGNANPVELLALNDLGTHYDISHNTVSAITRFERLVNPTLQHMMRTNVRTRSNQTLPTVHSFGTLEHAQMIASTLVEGTDYVWDYSAMQKYHIADKVEAKRNAKEELTLAMVKEGKSLKEIADALEVSEERAKKYIHKANKTIKLITKTEAIRLHAKGMSKTDIAIELGISRSTLNKYLTE
jgi:DNA-binding CsgD family transcriptional regulator